MTNNNLIDILRSHGFISNSNKIPLFGVNLCLPFPRHKTLALLILKVLDLSHLCELLNTGYFNMQEWPICVTYGAILGYSIAMAASLVLSHQRGLQHVKRD